MASAAVLVPKHSRSPSPPTTPTRTTEHHIHQQNILSATSSYRTAPAGGSGGSSQSSTFVSPPHMENVVGTKYAVMKVTASDVDKVQIETDVGPPPPSPPA